MAIFGFSAFVFKRHRNPAILGRGFYFRVKPCKSVSLFVMLRLEHDHDLNFRYFVQGQQNIIIARKSVMARLQKNIHRTSILTQLHVTTVVAFNPITILDSRTWRAFNKYLGEEKSQYCQKSLQKLFLY
jgi:hypothetical protein